MSMKAATFNATTFNPTNLTWTNATGTNTTSTGTLYLPGLSAPAVTGDLLCWGTSGADANGKVTHQATNCTIVSSIRFKEHVKSLG